ncbi:integrase core domain-containing protein [Pseudorhizobium tarimense]|nr:integrase core domain-containing protein [Pseudorhizobium tarimense]
MEEKISSRSRLIDGWIEDYNEIHPHSALKMASPRQFIRAKSN